MFQHCLRCARFAYDCRDPRGPLAAFRRSRNSRAGRALLSFPLLVVLVTACGCATAPGDHLAACRPRLFFRAQSWDGGLSVEQLRQRAGESPFREQTQRLRTTIANLSMKWLIDGDEAAAGSALALMKEWKRGVQDSEDGIQLIDLALGYDWLHNWPGFTEADKREVAGKLVKTAEKMRELLSDRTAHVFHTRMYAWTAAAGVTGLALHDTHPAGRGLFAFARDYYEKRLIPARRMQGGVMHNGFLYGMSSMMFPLVQFLEAAKSAAGIDYFHTARQEDSEWLREMADYLIYGTQPDMRTVRHGDLTTDVPNKHFRFMLDILAAEYRMGHAAELARQISEHYKTSGYHAEHIYMFMAFHDPRVKPEPLDNLPRFRVFSANGTGHVFWRSDWTRDATLTMFRCGDYFDDHGHFDQGSFTIFRKQALALKAGFYDFSSDHRLHWYKQAISVNTVIFNDPSDAQDEGRQRNIRFQEADTVEQYEKNRHAGACVESGNILAIDDPEMIRCDRGEFHYVSADVTPAWDGQKVKRYVRHIGVLDGRHVLVIDETETVNPKTRARWLLHAQVEPMCENGVWVVRLPETTLYVQPLLPAKPKVSVIGGPGHECEVNGVNHSYLAAEKYRRYNKGPAAEQPQPELGLWRMEVEHVESATRRLFVTVLTAADPAEKPIPARAVQDGSNLQVWIGDTCLRVKLQ